MINYNQEWLDSWSEEARAAVNKAKRGLDAKSIELKITNIMAEIEELGKPNSKWFIGKDVLETPLDKEIYIELLNNKIEALKKEYENKLTYHPSQYSVGDTVYVKNVLNKDEEAYITSIKFTKSRVYYGLVFNTDERADIIEQGKVYKKG